MQWGIKRESNCSVHVVQVFTKGELNERFSVLRASCNHYMGHMLTNGESECIFDSKRHHDFASLITKPLMRKTSADGDLLAK